MIFNENICVYFSQAREIIGRITHLVTHRKATHGVIFFIQNLRTLILWESFIIATKDIMDCKV